MKVLKPRSRIISIRLSDEEYLTLRQLCSATGARSVSDLARDAMNVFLNGANRDDMLDLRMDDFLARLRNMDRKIDKLAEHIASSASSSDTAT